MDLATYFFELFEVPALILVHCHLSQGCLNLKVEIVEFLDVVIGEELHFYLLDDFEAVVLSVSGYLFLSVVY